MKKKRYLIPIAITLSTLFTACNEGDKAAREQVTNEEGTIAEEIREGNDVEEPKIPAEIDTTITIQTVGNTTQEMAFSNNEIRVQANSKIKVVLENNAENEDMVHNIVFLKENRVEEVARLGQQAGEENNYIPDLPAVFEGSELAEPGETVEMLFTAPFQSGEYAFICTYPGHWQEMNGKLIVETVATTE